MHPLFEHHLSDALAPVCRPGDRVLLGVSGGADSVALLRGLARIADERALGLVAAHYNHGVRSGAVDDQRWVARLCERLGVPLVTNWEEPQGGDSISPGEAELREARYEFLRHAARREECRVLCLAHHADDQIETVLHHLIRGTSLRGLAGIRPVRELDGDIVLCRPLLKVGRHEILDYLLELNQDFREDPTNRETIYTRNRLRHELLPLLGELNPHFGDHLQELTAQAAEAFEFHAGLVNDAIEKAVISREPEQVRLLIADVVSLPAFLRRDLLVELWSRQHWPRQKMGSREWRKLAGLLEQDSARLSFPGQITAERTGAMLRLTRTRS